MIEESVTLNFAGAGLDELEARLLGIADRMVERLRGGVGGAAFAGGGAGPGAAQPGGAAAGFGAGGGGGGGAGRAKPGGFEALGLAAIEGAGQGLGNLSPATVSSPAVAARAAIEGAAGGVISTAGALAGGAAGLALGGPGGAVAGAALGKAASSYAMAQFNALEESIHRPEDTTAQRLGSYVGLLEAHGIHVSNQWIEQQARVGISLERRRLAGERRAERITKETGINMMSGAIGIGRLGR